MGISVVESGGMRADGNEKKEMKGAHLNGPKLSWIQAYLRSLPVPGGQSLNPALTCTIASNDPDPRLDRNIIEIRLILVPLRNDPGVACFTIYEAPH